MRTKSKGKVIRPHLKTITVSAGIHLKLREEVAKMYATRDINLREAAEEALLAWIKQHKK